MINLTAYAGGYVPQKAMAAGGSDTTAATTANTSNSAAILPLAGSTDKHYENLRAEAALKGHCLQRYADGFLISRWGQTKEFGTLTAVEAFLARVGGKS